MTNLKCSGITGHTEEVIVSMRWSTLWKFSFAATIRIPKPWHKMNTYYRMLNMICIWGKCEMSIFKSGIAHIISTAGVNGTTGLSTKVPNPIAKSFVRLFSVVTAFHDSMD